MKYTGPSIITPRQVGTAAVIIATSELVEITKTLTRQEQNGEIVNTYNVSGHGTTEYTEAQLA